MIQDFVQENGGIHWVHQIYQTSNCKSSKRISMALGHLLHLLHQLLKAEMMRGNLVVCFHPFFHFPGLRNSSFFAAISTWQLPVHWLVYYIIIYLTYIYRIWWVWETETCGCCAGFKVELLHYWTTMWLLPMSAMEDWCMAGRKAKLITPFLHMYRDSLLDGKMSWKPPRTWVNKTGMYWLIQQVIKLDSERFGKMGSKDHPRAKRESGIAESQQGSSFITTPSVLV